MKTIKAYLQGIWQMNICALASVSLTFIQMQNDVSALPLQLFKRDDFPISTWTGWLMRFPLGLNDFTMNSKVSFLDKFCFQIHWENFRANAEIHRTTLYYINLNDISLQTSLFPRKVLSVYNSYPLVAAGCFWFSSDFRILTDLLQSNW